MFLYYVYIKHAMLKLGYYGQTPLAQRNLSPHEVESTHVLTHALHSGGKFEEQIGSKGSADPEQLHYALWTASQLLSGASSKASKRILIFTKDENPAGEAGTFK